MPDSKITDVLDEPAKLHEAKVHLMEKISKTVAELTPQELREEWDLGRLRHNDHLPSIDSPSKFRSSIRKAFWHSCHEDLYSLSPVDEDDQ